MTTSKKLRDMKLPPGYNACLLLDAAAEIDRLTRERDELVDEVALKVACINGMSKAADKLAGERDEARAEREALRSAIRWALGYDEGDPQFGEQPEQKGAFAWRTELRRRAGTALAQIEQERSEQGGGAGMSDIVQRLRDLGLATRAQLEAAEEIEKLRRALRDCDVVARKRGDKYGLCDCIDNGGGPYQSQWLADLLAQPVGVNDGSA